MPDSFLELSHQDRALVLRDAATRTGRSENVLEKDIWLCWTLEKLFVMPGHPPMVFKGGTSLSKVYNAIKRFSEDIDVTIDWRGKGVVPDPFALSRSQRDKERDAITKLTRDYVADTVRPYFHSVLTTAIHEPVKDSVIEGKDKDQLRIYYPNVVPWAGYLGEGVLLEFGGRNSLEPHDKCDIETYAASPLVTFPSAKAVPVLSPHRTFWEKVTLVHSACGKPGSLIDKAGKNRISRHWYDLAMLADHNIGREALTQRHLLEDVIKYKTTFYRTTHDHYDECLKKRTRLIPSDDKLAELRKDFDEMKHHGMFDGEPPRFDEIIDRLHHLTQAVNKLESDALSG